MLGCISVALLSVAIAVLFLPRDWLVDTGVGEASGPPGLLLSRRELALCDGAPGARGLYLAVLGQVFDVRSGAKHYGPGGVYRGLAGKDASLAFITGDFSDRGLTDDLSGVSPLQAVALFDWLAFYQRTYQNVGRVSGRFYSDSGQPTPALLQVRALLAEGQRVQSQLKDEMTRLPTCNSEWSAATGGRVWCSTKSGGVERAWVGVPRKLFSPGPRGGRCVCVEDPSAAEKDPNLQQYDGCPPHADSCSVPD